MNEALFQELVGSIREAGSIRRGQAQPARTTRFDEVDVRAIRERFHLSQPGFADMLGISVGTLRGWEQGRRYPEGPARVLLRVAEARPDVVLSVTRARAAAAGEPLPPAPNGEAAPQPRGSSGDRRPSPRKKNP